MKLGIHFMNFTLPGEPQTLAGLVGETAKIADEGGVNSFTFMDHWFQMEAFSNAHEPMLEGYTSLGFVAGLSERLKLGLLVTGVTYRHPGLLAKIIATLDVLSGGRAFLGLGAAWYEREHLALGVHYPEIKHRFEMVEETLQICRQMWGPDEGPFDGKHFHLAETICQPRPIQSHIPILIGGGGEKKTLKLVARYGDATNLFGGDVETLQHKLDVLKAHCEAEGRDYDEIEQTVLSRTDPVADPDAFFAEVEQFRALGFDEVKMSAKTDNPPAWLSEVVEKVIPRLSEI